MRDGRVGGTQSHLGVCNGRGKVSTPALILEAEMYSISKMEPSAYLGFKWGCCC